MNTRRANRVTLSLAPEGIAMNGTILATSALFSVRRSRAEPRTGSTFLAYAHDRGSPVATEPNAELWCQVRKFNVPCSVAFNLPSNIGVSDRSSTRRTSVENYKSRFFGIKTAVVRRLHIGTPGTAADSDSGSSGYGLCHVLYIVDWMRASWPHFRTLL